VKVVGGGVVTEGSGAEPKTTNNRMELRALIEGFKLITASESFTLYTDSDLCVKTMTLWAPVWQRSGWRRKGNEPIANIDLVKEAFALYTARPNCKVTWIKGHSGLRWNEYADALSRSHVGGSL